MQKTKTHLNRANNAIPTLPAISSPVLSKSAPHNNNNNNNNDNNNNSSANINKVLVLTKNDLERIANHLNRKQREQEEILDELKRKKELHEKSLTLTQGWNNTIKGARRFKLEQKKVRDEKQEEKRRAMDLEHAEYLAQERRKVIEQAKLLQYNETDKVKTFHSAMKLSEILKEREAQIEMKKIMEQLSKDYENEIDRKNFELMNSRYEQDDKLCGKKQEQINELTDFIKKQIQERKSQGKQSQEEKRRDAELMQQLQEQLNQEHEQLAKIRMQKMRNLKETYDKAMENRMRIKEAERLMDEEENEDIRVYANAKKKMAIMKRERENEQERRKEEHRERMMAYLGSLLKQHVEDEDFRIAKTVQKQEAKRAKEERDKETKLRRDIEEIHKHRLDTIKRKEDEATNRQKEEEESMRAKMQADLMYQMLEREKYLKALQKQKEISENNAKLINERKDLERRLRDADKQFMHRELELMQLEDKQFEDYATRVIDYMKQHDRNTYPMEKVLNGSNHKQNQTNKSEASVIKKHQNDVPTKKNLGFM